jgi:hypothetical protein
MIDILCNIMMISKIEDLAKSISRVRLDLASSMWLDILHCPKKLMT